MTPEPTLTDEGKKCVCELDPNEEAVCDSPEYEADHFNGRVCTICDHDAACHAQPTNAVTQRGE
jgi:hypothetical protein